MKKQILAVTSLILVAGCTPVAEFLKESADPDSSMSRAYGEKLIAEEMEAYKKQGNSIVKGQAFLTTPGETRFAAGCEVWLIPTTLGVNSYRIGMYINNFEIIHDLIDKGQAPKDDYVETIEFNKELKEFTRTTVADGYGNFEFRNLPRGKYTALCLISAGQRAMPFVVNQEITLGEIDSQKVILTRKIDSARL
jgi:hypothetical protein